MAASRPRASPTSSQLRRASAPVEDSSIHSAGGRPGRRPAGHVRPHPQQRQPRLLQRRPLGDEVEVKIGGDGRHDDLQGRGRRHRADLQDRRRVQVHRARLQPAAPAAARAQVAHVQRQEGLARSRRRSRRRNGLTAEAEATPVVPPARLPAQPDRPRVPAPHRRAQRLRGPVRGQDPALPQAALRRGLRHRAAHQRSGTAASCSRRSARGCRRPAWSRRSRSGAGTRRRRRRSSRGPAPRAPAWASAWRRPRPQVFGERVTFTVNRPVASVEEAKKLAEAKLTTSSWTSSSGDGLCIGSADIQAGIGGQDHRQPGQDGRPLQRQATS